jgi:hypothetical protein
MADKYNTQLDKHIIEPYKLEKGDGELDLAQVAYWAIEKGLWKQPIEDQVEKLRKQLAVALRAKTFTDDDGNQPRANYCVRRDVVDIKGRRYVQTVWANIDVATHEFMEESFSQRRSGIANICYQAHIDKTHWNKFRRGKNPEIQMPLDFSNDVADRLHSTDYQPEDLEGL